LDLFLGGTFPPLRRASERPIATACFLLFTVFPDVPDLSFPRFILRIALFTFFETLLPYFFLDDDFKGIVDLLGTAPGNYRFAVVAIESRAN
jgi:hypothetical protein